MRLFLRVVLPVPDLVSRYRVRRLAIKLVTCDPWPGMTAKGPEAAQLAVLRLRFLQRETRRAVRSRQNEAASMLARASIETLITGLYCLYEPDAVAQLQGEAVRNLPLLLGFLSDIEMIPKEVLAECISRLGYGAPAKAPGVEDMARRVGKATDDSISINLYNRFYRPTSTFAVHTGAASLLRHVRADGHTSRTPQRTWARRSPVRIADASLGLLTATVAREAGVPNQVAVRYVIRHGDRALAPVLVMSASGLKGAIHLRQLTAIIAQLRIYHDYIWSGEDSDNQDARQAKIRAGVESLLLQLELDIPAGALDPYLDWIAKDIASKTASTE